MNEKVFREALAEAEAEMKKVVEKLSAMEPLVQRRTYLESFIAHTKNLLPPSTLAASDERTEARPTPVTDGDHMPFWIAMKKALIAGNRPMSVPEILEAIQKTGRKMPEKFARETVRSTMLRKTDVFERIETGRYGLREWPDSIKKGGR